MAQQEYVPGGDFRTLLNNSGVLREEHARFYMAEMFVACNELHKLGYIHRDLKPEVRFASQGGLRTLPCSPRVAWPPPAELPRRLDGTHQAD